MLDSVKLFLMLDTTNIGKAMCRGDNFCKDFKNVNFVQIGTCTSTCKLCLAYLLNFAEQDSLAELAHRGGLSDQKIKKGTFLTVEKISY